MQQKYLMSALVGVANTLLYLILVNWYGNDGAVIAGYIGDADIGLAMIIILMYSRVTLTEKEAERIMSAAVTLIALWAQTHVSWSGTWQLFTLALTTFVGIRTSPISVRKGAISSFLSLLFTFGAAGFAIRTLAGGSYGGEDFSDIIGWTIWYAALATGFGLWAWWARKSEARHAGEIRAPRTAE